MIYSVPSDWGTNNITNYQGKFAVCTQEVSVAELINSPRSLNKATYLPTRSQNGPSPNTTRALVKVAALRQLNLQTSDVDRLAEDPAVQAMVRTTPLARWRGGYSSIWF